MSFAKNARFLATNASKMIQSRGYSDKMALTFAAANRTFYDNVEVRQIDVPSFSGSFGILAKHVPTLAVLKPGVVQVIENDGKTAKFFVSSGSITVNADSSVQVLAEEAHNVEDLDISACREVLLSSQKELASSSSELAKAEAAIAVECAEALVNAAEK